MNNSDNVDVYKVVLNPTNLVFKYELWVIGVVYNYYSGATPADGQRDVRVCQKVNSYRTKELAEAKVSYYLELAAFKRENGL